MRRVTRRLLIATLVAQLTGCGFAVRHPAATAAIAAGTIALGSCELESSNQKACLLVGGGAAAFLGLVAGLAMWTMGGDHEEEVLRDPLLENPQDGPQDLPAEPPDPTTRPTLPVKVVPQTPIPRLPAPTDPPPPAPPTDPAPPTP